MFGGSKRLNLFSGRQEVAYDSSSGEAVKRI
jgi:hypothetical protein